jgi:hypothetical protein
VPPVHILGVPLPHDSGTLPVVLVTEISRTIVDIVEIVVDTPGIVPGTVLSCDIHRERIPLGEGAMVISWISAVFSWIHASWLIGTGIWLAAT